MSDAFLDALSRELRAAERRLAPRRRWRVGGVVRRSALVSVVVIAAGVPAIATTQDWDPFSGPRDSEKVAAIAPVPDAGDRRRASEVPQVGVMSYRSHGGLVCLAAGVLRDGHVGRLGRNGRFYRLNAANAAGACGDIAENLADFGGIGLAHEGYSEDDASAIQAVVYGLTASRFARVRVTWRDGRTETVAVTPTDAPEELQGAEGVFAVPGLPGTSSRGATLELLRPDDTVMHTFEF
jgi:hypothetical protein